MGRPGARILHPPYQGKEAAAMQLTSLGFLFVLLPVGGGSCWGIPCFLWGCFPHCACCCCWPLWYRITCWPGISPWPTHGPGPSCWAASSRTSLWQWSALSLPNWISSSSRWVFPSPPSPRWATSSIYITVNVTPSMIPSATGYSAASSASCISAPSFRHSSSSPSWMIPK